MKALPIAVVALLLVPVATASVREGAAQLPVALFGASDAWDGERLLLLGGQAYDRGMSDVTAIDAGGVTAT